MYELTQCSSDCLIESVVAYCHSLGIVWKISALQESDIAGLLTSLSTIAQNARLDGGPLGISPRTFAGQGALLHLETDGRRL